MGFSSGGFDVGTATAYLDLNTLAFNKAIEESQKMFQTFADKSTTAAQKWQSVGQNLTNFGSNLTRNVTTPILGLAQSSINAYKDFESAFTGVKKTVELSESDMKRLGVTWDDLSDIIVNMAKNTASSSEEIAGVMEVAGQLGVPLGQGGKDIEKFTKTMVMLGDSTNLSAAEAADALARFSNITGGSVSNIDRLGSSVVSLGNNFATQEDEIVMMSTRLASAGTIAGLSETEILALATAMTSVGIKAEAGGTAMSQTLSKVTGIIAKATDTTSEGSAEAAAKLEKLASVSGMTSEEFVRTWKNEPIQAISAFISGLGQMSDNAEESVLTLDELGFTGIRQSNMLRALALSSENMASALEVSNKAYEENTALSDEANKRYETTDAKLNQLNERWKEMKRDLAEMLIPILQQLMDILQKLIDWWMSLDEGTKQSIVNFALLAAALGPVLSILGNVITTVSMLVRIFTSVGGVLKTVITGFEKFKVAMDLTKAGYTGFESISKLGASLANIGNVIGTIIKTLSGIGLVISGAILSVKSFFDMWQNGWSALSTILEALGLALAAIGAVLLGAPALVAGIVAAVVFAVSQIVILVKDNWEDIKKTTSDAWNAIVNFFKDGWEKIKGIGATALEVIKYFFTDILGGALEFLGNLLSNVVEFLGNIFSNIGSFIVNVTTSVVSFFANIISNVASFVSDVIGRVVSFISDIIGRVSDFVSKIFNFVKNLFSDIISRVVEFISSVVSKVVSFFADIIGKLVSHVATIISKVAEFLGNIIQKIVGFIGDVLGKLSSFAGNVLEKAIKIGSNLLNGIWEKVKEIPGKISGIFHDVLNFLGGLYDRFFGSGQNMFQGLWNGLKSIWDSIWGWLQGIWDAVTGFFSGLWDRVSGGVSSVFNGSHANGLTYVPFNGYMAQLHEGERVLTKQEARDYNNNNTKGSGDTYNFYNTKPDPYEYSRQMKIAKIKQSITGNNSPSETSPIYV